MMEVCGSHCNPFPNASILGPTHTKLMFQKANALPDNPAGGLIATGFKAG